MVGLKKKASVGTQARLSSLAWVICDITNPCVLSVFFLLVVSYSLSSDPATFISWCVIMLLFLLILPLGYIYLRLYLSQALIGYRTNPTNFLKTHPKDVIILGIVFGLLCLVTLLYFKAPSLLLCTLTALLVTSFLVSVCNIFYRVSYHLSAITILVIMAVVIWGPILLILLVTIPIIGWAKYRIQDHTILQLILGIVLSAAICLATAHFYLVS